MPDYLPFADVPVEAFQWLGDPLEGYDLPGWARGKALHAPSTGVLDVPCSNGTMTAKPTDWVVHYASNDVMVLSDVLFRLTYNTAPADAEAQKAYDADLKTEAKAPVLTTAQKSVRAIQASARVRAENTAAEAPDNKPTSAQAQQARAAEAARKVP